MAAGDEQSYSRSYQFQWDHGDARLSVTILSHPEYDHPDHVGTAHLELGAFDLCRAAQAPPHMSFARAIRTSGHFRHPIRDLSSSAALELTPAWAGVEAGLAWCAHLPAEGREFFRERISHEVSSRARAAMDWSGGDQGRGVVAVCLLVQVTVHREFPDELLVVRDEDDDDDDEEEYEMMAEAAVCEGLVVEWFMGEEEKCMVCYDDMRKWDLCGWMPCGHCFHRDCIARWLVGKDEGQDQGQAPRRCPICRRGFRQP